ncbi:MAG: UDP-N-acetylglucosamine--N-acetylmuramyl-(pentapeptide) pyrophosphoryl-undecaprenol N-acetylglucosamine transferase [Anaerolineae bacterium]|nr:UDP-N-acetylglucosamine--N-acetylmuramyl-(pentapeptide) pyrophosphoryl-undecaprenol N-acetylglucosamine transferase [Anaerolineae bacterium]
MQLLIGAGGTGGHVYPALAVAEVLHRSGDGHELTFIGTRGGGGFEKQLVDAYDVPFAAYGEVFAGPIVGVNPLRAISSSVKMGIGVLQAFAFLGKHKPQAILLTGGWANVPVALAARARGIPMLIYLPDIEPGSTIKVLSRFAAKIATTVDASAQFFKPGHTVATGYPLRGAFMSATREQGIAHFGLSPERKTLLITGGSRGARSINQSIETILPDLLQDGIQVIHVTGNLDWERSQAATANLPDATNYYPFAYCDQMHLAYAASDVVVARAGASTLGELPFYGLPGILVPYPHAWRYQRVNADYLAERGAAIRLDDEKMADALLPTIRSLMYDEGKLSAMKASAKALGTGQGAQHIADLLIELAV